MQRRLWWSQCATDDALLGAPRQACDCGGRGIPRTRRLRWSRARPSFNAPWPTRRSPPLHTTMSTTSSTGGCGPSGPPMLATWPGPAPWPAPGLGRPGPSRERPSATAAPTAPAARHGRQRAGAEPGPCTVVSCAVHIAPKHAKEAKSHDMGQQGAHFQRLAFFLVALM